MRHFLDEAQTAEFHGCDIDARSIQWLTDHLSPPLQVFQNGEAPPLPRPDASFDLIWAASVFTHITDHWSSWLLELHRVLREGGLLIASFLGRGMSDKVAQEEWEADRIGMNVLRYGQGWEHGGPMVLLSPWWIAEHWGRAFEILELREAGFGWPNQRDSMQGVVVLRKKAERPTREELERTDPAQWREVTALRHNIRQLQVESQMFSDCWQSCLRGQADEERQRAELDERRAELKAQRAELKAQRADLKALRSRLREVQTSWSWRITSLMLRAGGIARRLSTRSRRV